MSVEVAGIGSRESNLTTPKDTYEIEEDAPDLMQNFDYPEFIAMRAPRPTMLIHNAVDSCCFRAPLVKPYIYDNVKPFFDLYGSPQNLAWHENFEPGVHNYQLDNRRRHMVSLRGTFTYLSPRMRSSATRRFGLPRNSQSQCR